MSLRDDLGGIVGIIRTENFQPLGSKVFGCPIEKFYFLIDNENRLLSCGFGHGLTHRKADCGK